MLHCLHFDMPVLTNTWGAIGVGVGDRAVLLGDVSGETCWAEAAAAFLIASSMLCLTKGDITFSVLNDGSDKRKAISAGSNGRMRMWDEVEFGEIETVLPRGLFERRFGEGVNGGLPGNEGAQTICSGVTESPLTDKFSFPSIILSNSIRNWSDMADERERLRSRAEFEFIGEIRRTERSKGVVEVSRLFFKISVKFFWN